MRPLTEVIAMYLPNEKIITRYNITLIKEVNRTFNTPLSYFKDPGIDLYQGMELIETDNYWFVDTRSAVRPVNRIITLMSLALFFLIFGKQLLATNIPFLIAISTLFVFALIIYMSFLRQGMLVNVYEKQWVSPNKNGDKITLEVNLPKYSSDSIWKLKYKNRLLNFMGITASSAKMTINYLFKVNP